MRQGMGYWLIPCFVYKETQMHEVFIVYKDITRKSLTLTNVYGMSIGDGPIAIAYKDAEGKHCYEYVDMYEIGSMSVN